MKEVLLIKNGEIALKGLNRSTFEDILVKNIRRRLLASVGKFTFTKSQSTIIAEANEEDVDFEAAVDTLRKVFGIAAFSRAVVCEKDIDKNQVVLGLTEDLMKDSLVASDVNFIPFDKLENEIRVTAKTRYKQKEEAATVMPMEDGKAMVIFDNPQRAITKGQAVVFYSDDIVVGGGTIL